MRFLGINEDGNLMYFNESTEAFLIKNNINKNAKYKFNKSDIVVTVCGKDVYRVHQYDKVTFEADGNMLDELKDNWNKAGKTVKTFRDIKYRSFSYKLFELASRIRRIKDSEGGKVSYKTLREACLKGASEGFGALEFMNGIYRSRKGFNVSIDIDSIYEGNDKYCITDVNQALDTLEVNIDNHDIISGLNDRIYKVDALLDLGSDIKYAKIIPVIIRSKIDFNEEEKTVWIQPRYRDKNEMIYDLRKIYDVSKEMALRGMEGK